MVFSGRTIVGPAGTCLLFLRTYSRPRLLRAQVKRWTRIPSDGDAAALRRVPWFVITRHCCYGGCDIRSVFSTIARPLLADGAEISSWLIEQVVTGRHQLRARRGRARASCAFR